MIYNNNNNSRRQHIRNAYVPFNSLTFSEDTLSVQNLAIESTEESSLPWWKNIKKNKSTSSLNLRKTIATGSTQTTTRTTVKSKTTFKPMFTTSIYFPPPTLKSSIVKATEIFQYPMKNTGSNEGHKPVSEGPTKSKSTFVPTFTASIYSPSPTPKTSILDATEMTMKNIGSNKSPTTFRDAMLNDQDLTTEI